jgi:hypothetical protein
MVKRILLISSMVFCLTFGLSSAWGLDLEEGQYEITSRVEMPGMPESMPPVTVTRCLTKQNPVPNQSTGGQECRITDMKTQDNTVTWTMECSQGGSTMQATGTITFHGDRFEGETRMKMGPEAGNQVIITHMEGRRIGPCQ